LNAGKRGQTGWEFGGGGEKSIWAREKRNGVEPYGFKRGM